MLRITNKADGIAIVIGGKINKRWVVRELLKYHATDDGLISQDNATLVLDQLTDDTLGSGTGASFIKAFIRRGYLEVV